jgi:hypothetical protein
MAFRIARRAFKTNDVRAHVPRTDHGVRGSRTDDVTARGSHTLFKADTLLPIAAMRVRASRAWHSKNRAANMQTFAGPSRDHRFDAR